MSWSIRSKKVLSLLISLAFATTGLVATSSPSQAAAGDNSWSADYESNLNTICNSSYGEYQTTSDTKWYFNSGECPAIGDIEFAGGPGDALDTFGYVAIYSDANTSQYMNVTSASESGGVLTFDGNVGTYADVRVQITLADQKASWSISTYDYESLATTPVAKTVHKIEVNGNLGTDSGTTIVPDASGNKFFIYDGTFNEVLMYWNPGSGTFVSASTSVSSEPSSDDVSFFSGADVNTYALSVLAFRVNTCSGTSDAFTEARSQLTATPSRTATTAIDASFCPASVGDDVVINGGGGALSNGTDGIKIVLNSDENTDYNAEAESLDPSSGSDQIFLAGKSNVCCGGIGPSLNIGGELFGVSGAANDQHESDWNSIDISGLTGSASYDGGSSATGNGGLVITYTAIPESGLEYQLVRTVSYTSPNRYFTDSYDVVIPTGNTETVKFYMGGDTAPGTDDSGFGIVINKDLTASPPIPGKTLMSLNPNPESGMFIAYRETGTDYFDGFWSQDYSDDYEKVAAGEDIGTSLTDNLNKNVHDAGIMMQWTLPTAAGTYSRTVETIVDRYSGLTALFGNGTTAANFVSTDVIDSATDAAIDIQLQTSQVSDQTGMAFSLTLPSGVTATGTGTTTCSAGSVSRASSNTVINGTGITIPGASVCHFIVPVAFTQYGTYELPNSAASTTFPLLNLAGTSVDFAAEVESVTCTDDTSVTLGDARYSWNTSDNCMELDDVALTNTSDAFDSDMGEVRIYDGSNWYDFEASTITKTTGTNKEVYTGRGTINNGSDYVDVKVVLTIENHKQTWQVFTYRPGTSTPKSVEEIRIVGDVGSDDDTDWSEERTTSNSGWSHDGFDGDPLLYWTTTGQLVDVADGDDEPAGKRVKANTLTLTTLLFDYEEYCVDEAAVWTYATGFITATPNGTNPTAVPRVRCSGAPTEPLNLSDTRGEGTMTLSFSTPTDDGGSAITKYEYRLNNGEWVTVESTTSPIVITGLNDELTYVVELRAINDNGKGLVATYESEPGALNPDEAVETPDLSLALDLNVGAKVEGAQSTLRGSNLKSTSKYELILQSDPVVLYTGTTDPNGNINQLITLPGVCPAKGKHTLSLVGTRPDGSQAKAVAYLAFDSKCRVLAIVQGATLKSAKFGGIRFAYNSSRLTKTSKSNIRAMSVLLTDAKVIKVYGYTQTNLKSAASKKANKALAKRRALAVKSYLKKLGVTGKIEIVSVGAKSPVSKKKQYQNRRVTLKMRYLLNS